MGTYSSGRENDSIHLWTWAHQQDLQPILVTWLAWCAPHLHMHWSSPRCKRPQGDGRLAVAKVVAEIAEERGRAP